MWPGSCEAVKRTVSHSEHCVLIFFGNVVNDAHSVYIFAGLEQLFWCDEGGFEKRLWGCVFSVCVKCFVFRV